MKHINLFESFNKMKTFHFLQDEVMVTFKQKVTDICDEFDIKCYFNEYESQIYLYLDDFYFNEDIRTYLQSIIDYMLSEGLEHEKISYLHIGDQWRNKKELSEISLGFYMSRLIIYWDKSKYNP